MTIRNSFHKKSLAMLTAVVLCLAGSAHAQEAADAEGQDMANYELSVRDQIELIVYDEPDLTASQRIDGRGQIRVPLIGTTRIAGMTIREAEEYLEKAFIENRILRSPMVTIRVADYAPKEVAVLGAVESPGKLTFPIEENSMDIVDVISQMGGFTDMARSDNVRVTRVSQGGRKVDFTVNVERMISGKGRRRSSESRVEILPGDVIWVPQRIF